MVERGSARGHWYMLICTVDAVLNPTATIALVMPVGKVLYVCTNLVVISMLMPENPMWSIFDQYNAVVGKLGKSPHLIW